MRSSIASSVFIFVVCFSMLVIAVILWNDHKALEAVNSRGHLIFQKLDLATMSQFSVEPLGQALNILSRLVGEQPQLSTLAEAYLQRRPLDPKGWLWASGFLLRQDKQAEALEYLEVAHALSKRNSFILSEVFNRYLALGAIDPAIEVAHDLSIAKPSGFRRWFSVMVRVTPSTEYTDLIRRVIPISLPSHSKLSPDYYYSTALYEAKRIQNDELMDVLWDETPEEYKKDSAQGLAYLNVVRNRQDSTRLQSVWYDLTDENIEIGQITNPGFEAAIAPASPCFSSKKVSGVEWGRDQLSHQGEYSLKISFNGEENVSLSHAQCPITVKPGVSYAINGMWTGKNISTLSGVYVDVISPSIKGIYARTEAKIGRWPWETFKLQFTVPDDIEVALIRIRRKKTEFLDSKIAGDVWFDSLSLSPIGNN